MSAVASRSVLSASPLSEDQEEIYLLYLRLIQQAQIRGKEEISLGFDKENDPELEAVLKRLEKLGYCVHLCENNTVLVNWKDR